MYMKFKDVLREYRSEANKYIKSKVRLQMLFDIALNKWKLYEGPRSNRVCVGTYREVELFVRIIKDWVTGKYKEISKDSIVDIVAGLIIYSVDTGVYSFLDMTSYEDAKLLKEIYNYVNDDIYNYEDWLEKNPPSNELSDTSQYRLLNEDYKSKLNIKGEMIQCSSCENNVLLEYKNSSKYRKIQENIVFDPETNEYFTVFLNSISTMPITYVPENEGHYLTKSKICGDCLRKKNTNGNIILIDSDYISLKYVDVVTEIKSELGRLISHKYNMYLNDISQNTLRAVNEELFEEICKTKTFGLKKEKKRLSEMFVNESKASILQNYKDYILNSGEYKELVIKGQEFTSKYDDEVLNLIKNRNKNGKKVYKKIDYFKMNENKDTPKDITMRLGTKPTQNVEFYEKFNCDWGSIKTLVKDKEKFSFEVPGDRLIKSFTKSMRKMDFWI